MANKILIPTDFQVESLNTLRFALGEQRSPVKVVFLFGHHLTDSITQLLFYSRARLIREFVTPQFEEAVNVICSRYSNVYLDTEYLPLNANSSRLLRNVLINTQPTSVYVPANYKLKPPKNGFDPVPLLKKCGLPVCEVEWDSRSPVFMDELHVLIATANNISS